MSYLVFTLYFAAILGTGIQIGRLLEKRRAARRPPLRDRRLRIRSMNEAWSVPLLPPARERR